MGDAKYRVMNFFKTSTTMDCSKSKRVKNVYGGVKKQFKDSIISKKLRNPFKLKKEFKEIKERMITYIKKLFEQEEDYYKPAREGNFDSNNYIEYESNSDKNNLIDQRIPR